MRLSPQSNHLTQRTTRLRLVCILYQRRVAAGVDRSGRSAVRLSYKLTGSGWASAIVEDGERRYEIRNISYLSDALKDLMKAAVGLLGGATRVWFLWHDEPGEHRWIVNRDGDELLIHILWFDDAFKALPDEKGREVFRFTCRLANFVGEVLACGRGLLAEHGEEGYRDEWRSEFPDEEFGRLEWLINERRKKKRKAQPGGCRQRRDSDPVAHQAPDSRRA